MLLPALRDNTTLKSSRPLYMRIAKEASPSKAKKKNNSPHSPLMQHNTRIPSSRYCRILGPFLPQLQRVTEFVTSRQKKIAGGAHSRIPEGTAAKCRWGRVSICHCGRALRGRCLLRAAGCVVCRECACLSASLSSFEVHERLRPSGRRRAGL